MPRKPTHNRIVQLENRAPSSTRLVMLNTIRKATLFASLALAALLTGCTASKSPGNHVELDQPLKVSASTIGNFRGTDSWSLVASQSEGATLKVGDQTTNIEVTPAQFDELRRVVQAERFFELESQYGELVTCGSTQTLTITEGEQSHTVKILFLGNWALYMPEMLREPARAVRVMSVIRKWFDHPKAVDLREYDQHILDAVPKTNKRALEASL